MKRNAAFIFSDQFLEYHFHENHPFNQKRIQLTKELLEQSNALTSEDLLLPRKASDKEIALFHDEDYIEAVKRASFNQLTDDEKREFGLGTEDTPIFDGMHEASALLVGGSLTAVDEVINERVNHSLNIGGGLHHGFKRKASGFCIYNDAAIAIRYIRKNYNLRVLYVDTDAHHGDGVQSAFYDDPNVCTFSIHETGRYLFPGTGEVNERGIKQGFGYSFNLPIDAFTQDESFLEVYEGAIRRIAEFFKPDIIITQNGADAHTYDPLTHLCTSMKIYERIPEISHELAHEYCNGKWIALGGGGYDIWRVVPRAWAQIWNVMKMGTISTGPLPRTWIEKWKKESPVNIPNHWHDTNEEAFPYIPRKPEINDKNSKLLNQLLKYTFKPQKK
ncbi:acetoin utilization protein AcuC [Oceanobacillus caeni]|uniref:Acetoin utilization protein AcuC n=1 Tax=Oceanobacillus caeni TaxID=405946 RepID=A0ABR5MLD2_9BACI|nr:MULTISPECIES: acetoin utilization protein AcuC [Bacillaceae]KKE77668.1 histone deacetylase [Bacilli bacterium VT-13-104]PZD83227.1 acetoin utilization protein AcuC [Bacilli bacterium]KPH76776.1 histone deacetylase [Oceanobacillus caeni]MBU8792272.1 acetoin utilization protein AcuC [Oceanobacillus caeni]MCR1834233.1 acetoin utilization protein AcuC [Oceanobacillus caeni]